MTAPTARPYTTIDLRSDTVTTPTAGMRRAMADAEVGDDVLDGDPTTRRLEAVIAERLGKEQALFFPTGTMANQVAIWLLTTPGTELLVDADAHIVHSEMAATAALAGVQVRVVRSAAPIFGAADLAAALSPSSPHNTELSLVCVENTHNGAGGMVTPLREMRALRAVATSANLPLHLDGARLWNAAAASGTSVAEFSACADTVMVSCSKALGAPIGSLLAGSRDAMMRAVRARRRFGGGMRQSGVLAAAALYGLEHHLARIPEDHEAARYLANMVHGVAGAAVVPPDTNIVMIDLPSARGDAVVARAAQLGVRISAWTPTRLRAITHLNAPIAAVAEAAPRLAQALHEVLSAT